jgi:phage gp46-like protein
MARITDIKFEQGSDGIFDIVVDTATRDLATVSGLETSTVMSLFSDRRARVDEVADPMKRRGWIGNLVSDRPNDNFGSGLWLYEQRKLLPDVVAGVRNEAQAALEWQAEDGIAKSVTASVTSDPTKRSISLLVDTQIADGGGRWSASYVLVNATRTGLLARF